MAERKKPAAATAVSAAQARQALRARIQAAVQGLQYGQVVIVIKDGRVTQIDRTEKQRIIGVEGIFGDGI